MIFFNKTRLLLLCSLILSHAVHAQTDHPFKAADGFRLVSLFGNFDDMAYEYNGQVTPLTVSSGTLSASYPSPKTDNLIIFRELPLPPTAPAGTPPERKILANIALLPAVKSQIVLLAPTPKGPTELRGLSVDGMTESHALGTARLINLTSRDAGVTFGKRVYKAKAQTTDLLMPFPTGISKIIVAVELKEENTWQPAIHMQRRLSDRSRMYVIMVDRQPTEENPLPVYPLVLFEYSRAPLQSIE